MPFCPVMLYSWSFLLSVLMKAVIRDCGLFWVTSLIVLICYVVRRHIFVLWTYLIFLYKSISKVMYTRVRQTGICINKPFSPFISHVPLNNIIANSICVCKNLTQI